MKNKKLFNFNMPMDIYEYLSTESKKNYTTMTQYIINLILEDKKKSFKTKGFWKVPENGSFPVEYVSQTAEDLKNDALFEVKITRSNDISDALESTR